MAFYTLTNCFIKESIYDRREKAGLFRKYLLFYFSLSFFINFWAKVHSLAK